MEITSLSNNITPRYASTALAQQSPKTAPKYDTATGSPVRTSMVGQLLQSPATGGSNVGLSPNRNQVTKTASVGARMTRSHANNDIGHDSMSYASRSNNEKVGWLPGQKLRYGAPNQ